ncbi:hypothetical protein [Micromonospora sp. NPDC049497]|uniref:hypothetical protein n=1 Tax=Micromonospora sp. NPDC049497 TaxID=3364273 RepID=UPI00379C0A63
MAGSWGQRRVPATPRSRREAPPRAARAASASGPLDIARAAAAEDGAYSGNWQVTAYAICADPVGAAAEGSVQTGVSSASHVCTGAGSTGQTFLNSLYPDAGLRAVRLSLTGVPSDGLAIQAICA